MPYQDPDHRISVAQLNSDLRHVQQELLHAHNAAQQLRLRYSTDDLARLGQRDVLHKSLEAASALSQFYSAIEKKIPAGDVVPAPAIEPSEEQIAKAVSWLCSYLQTQREQYFPGAHPLSSRQVAVLSPYSSADSLNRIRINELHGARISAPEFLSEARALGFENLPDMPHMESATFVDVVVFNEKLTERSLFHGLVHSIQMQILGLQRYAELWVRNFIKTRIHYTVLLEVHAFSLASRFMRPEREPFSVEDEVRQWAAGRY